MKLHITCSIMLVHAHDGNSRLTHLFRLNVWRRFSCVVHTLYKRKPIYKLEPNRNAAKNSTIAVFNFFLNIFLKVYPYLYLTVRLSTTSWADKTSLLDEFTMTCKTKNYLAKTKFRRPALLYCRWLQNTVLIVDKVSNLFIRRYGTAAVVELSKNRFNNYVFDYY